MIGHHYQTYVINGGILNKKTGTKVAKNRQNMSMSKIDAFFSFLLF